MPDVLAPFAFKRWTGHALRVGVAPASVALVRTSVWPHERALLLDELRVDAAEPAALAAASGTASGTASGAALSSALGAALAELLDRHRMRGWPLTLVLADELVRLWQVAPPEGSTRLADLQGAAALRFQSLFGAGAADWQIEADWNATRPFLAAALPRALSTQLVQAVRGQRCHLVEMVPQFVAVLNQYRSLRRPGAWFGLVHGGVLSVAAFDGKTLAAVRTTVIPPGADRDWLEGHVAREALRVGMQRPERLQLCGPVPKGWTSSPGRLKFACTAFEDALDAAWPDVARLALSGARP